jgi:hypothetical protein
VNIVTASAVVLVIMLMVASIIDGYIGIVAMLDSDVFRRSPRT